MATFTALGKKGRLGNQLFQIAAAYATSIKQNECCILPLWFYSKYFVNYNNLIHTKNVIRCLDYKERHFHYQEIPNHKNLNLNGYFQCERYFKEYESNIRQLFYLEPNPIDYCAIHIRRGDYLFSNVHLKCSLDYYKQAIDIIKQYNSNQRFLVFSDDIEYCKNVELFQGTDFEFSEANSDIEDFKKMTNCGSFVIANSSFSWWAAWLSNSNLIIAPQNWLASHYANDKDVVPENWIKLKST